MKEINVKKYECDYCKKIYDRKESATACENEHKKLTKVPVKEISYNDEFDEFTVRCYYNAVSKKNIEGDVCIRLQDNYNFHKLYYFNFDNIHHCGIYSSTEEENNNLIVYTKNFDKEYEKELIKKMIDFRINELYKKIDKLNERKEQDFNIYVRNFDYK